MWGPARTLLGLTYAYGMSSVDEVLRVLLERADVQERAVRFDELPGFLFAIANAPELIPPSEWIGEVFGGEMPVFDDAVQAQAVHGALLEQYNEVNEFSLECEEGELPPGCSLLADPTRNLEDNAPIAHWAQGFRKGYLWLEDTWHSYLPDEEPTDDEELSEMSEELLSIIMVLGFFSARRLAEAFARETGGELSAMTNAMYEAFPVAIQGYISIGRSMQEAYAEAQEPVRRASPKVGRNDPCPCGSGKKYKRCCGAAA